MSLVQVGIIALRESNGEFLPAEPIYRDISEENTPPDEYLPLDRLTEIFADKFKTYKAASKQIGAESEATT